MKPLHIYLLCTVLLAVRCFATKASLPDGLVVITAAEGVIADAATGRCYNKQGSVHSCQQLGASTALGFTVGQQEPAPLNAVLAAIRSTPCTSNGFSIMLVQALDKAADAVYIDVGSLHPSSRYWSWFVYGVRVQVDQGSTYTYNPIRLQDLCHPQSMCGAASHKRSLLQQYTGPTGSVIGWGATDLNQLPVSAPAAVSTPGAVTTLVAGRYHIVAVLSSNNTVLCWGQEDERVHVPQQVQGGKIKELSAGSTHTLALMEGSGDVICWGINTDGQCDTTGMSGMIAVRASWYTSFAQHSNLSWVAFGDRAAYYTDPPEGRHVVDMCLDLIDYIGLLTLLDNGTISSTNQIDLLAPNEVATSICCGGGYAVALLNDGTARAWGAPAFIKTYIIPDSVQGKIMNISCGGDFVVAKLNDSSLFVWGRSTAVDAAQPPPGVTNNVQYAVAGDVYSAYLLTSGIVVQAGYLATSGPIIPSQLSSSTDIIGISASSQTTVALTRSGTVVPWGYLWTRIQNMPTTLTNSITVKVSAGYRHALALSSTGTVTQWGTFDTPVPLAAQSGVTDIAAGNRFSLAVAGGRVVAWGDAEVKQYQCNITTHIPPAALANVTKVSSGFDHALALKSDGSVIAWGCDDLGQLAIPQNVTNVTAISAGAQFSLALLKSGEVVSWGDPTYNITPPVGLRNVTAIAAGSTHALALLHNGTVVAFGTDFANFTDVPPNTKAFAIAAGELNSYALTYPTSPAPPQPSPPGLLPPNQPTVLTSSKRFPTGAIIGIAVGGSIVLLAVAAALVFAFNVMRKQEHKPKPFGDVAGIIPGEVFSRATAFEYSWIETAPADAEPLVPDDSPSMNAIELNHEQLNKQVQLVRDGLLGRGATALVFKCVWPSRFGPNKLLAAKVLKDGYELDVRTLESFCYESTVLASLNPPHPCVIRLLGYCLEPPTVCLILELLPTSLKSIIYKEPKAAQTTTITTMGFTSSTVSPPSKWHTSSSNNSTVYLTADSTANEECVAQVKVVQDPSFKKQPSSTSSQTLSALTSTPSLTMLQVLQISIDIADGLRYLHEMPLTSKAIASADGMLGTVDETDTVTDTSNTGFHGSNSMSSPQRNMKIVHRDLKPANILIGVDGRAKISDFGLARQQMNTTMMTENVGAGTLPYMAPELLVGARMGAAAANATNRVDIYALGMIMYELLTCKMPWYHLNESHMIAAVLGGRRPELPNDKTPATPINTPLSELPATVNAMPEFNAIIRACWQQREHRRPNAAALHKMLVELLYKYSGDEQV